MNFNKAGGGAGRQFAGNRSGPGAGPYPPNRDRGQPSGAQRGGRGQGQGQAQIQHQQQQQPYYEGSMGKDEGGRKRTISLNIY